MDVGALVRRIQQRAVQKGQGRLELLRLDQLARQDQGDARIVRLGGGGGSQFGQGGLGLAVLLQIDRQLGAGAGVEDRVLRPDARQGGAGGGLQPHPVQHLGQLNLGRRILVQVQGEPQIDHRKLITPFGHGLGGGRGQGLGRALAEVRNGRRRISGLKPRQGAGGRQIGLSLHRRLIDGQGLIPLAAPLQKLAIGPVEQGAQGRQIGQRLQLGLRLGVFAALFDEQDAIISADLNHASLIDGIRLSKAARHFYKFDDMADLEKKLQDAQGSRNRVIVTDGVFSMDGDIADLKSICNLAEKYDALVLVDDSHATGFIGENGRGTLELCGVEGRVDILTSTLGKALGGAGGGFVASKKEVIDKLRNKARPYLFSNNILPAVAATGIEILEMISQSKTLIKKLADNTAYFRQKMVEAGFDVRDKNGVHPVVPVMLFDAILASKFAKMMVEEESIYVIAFSFPVVPKNEARIRVQISAAHEKDHLDAAIAAFIKVGKKLNVIK